MSLNLSSQPFVNSRPVRRLVLVLWCLSALLVAADLFLYTRHYSGQQARRDRLEALTAQEARERDRLAELETQLAGFDLGWQRRQIDFLNLRIAARVFPWSRLFDRVAEALPPQVRLTKLRPEIVRPKSADAAEELVRLEIQAEANSEEAMLNFVNRLFKHRSFSSPNLASESRRRQSGLTDFSLTVTYLPESAEPPPPAAAPAAAPEGAP